MNWERIAKSGFVSQTLLFGHEAFWRVCLHWHASRTTAPCRRPQTHEAQAPNRDDRTGGRGHQTLAAPSDRANLHRRHRSGLAPLLQQRCGVRYPWNRNWKSSASNEQGFEVFYDFATTLPSALFQVTSTFGTRLQHRSPKEPLRQMSFLRALRSQGDGHG
jgi:hypothetical protein